MSDYKPEPKESWVSYFRRTRKFSDLMLMVWSLMEFNIDQIVTRQFGLFYEDKKARILLDMNFSKKLDFLKENKTITNNEFKILNDFKKYRNELFHGKKPHYFILSDAEKDKIMDNAVKVANLLQKILFRKNVNDS